MIDDHLNRLIVSLTEWWRHSGDEIIDWVDLALSGNLDVHLENQSREASGQWPLLMNRPRSHAPERWSVRRINAVLSQMASTKTTYLEIGLEGGLTIENVRATTRIGVDPEPLFDLDRLPDNMGVFIGTSDEFFAGLDRTVRFDVAFIDGLHTFEQTYCDVINALNRIGENGVVLIDDTLPSDEVSAIPDRDRSYALRQELGLPGWPWHGDVWKVMVAIADGHRDLDYRTIVGSGNPQTLLWRRPGHDGQETFNTDLVDKYDGLDYIDVFTNSSTPEFLKATTESDALACWAARALL